ncbi:hypothetical protein AVEN_261994-1 [Araneus ventricosus]|uniref:Uncharacterized protein n=1 Tax=Araneus ventricosus TaxID=182803 RepID=A0A4Y2HCD6_ARAVE|nr:hypothetical protein AVEN_261994-1 [Araneus ventricosus]
MSYGQTSGQSLCPHSTGFSRANSNYGQEKRSETTQNSAVLFHTPSPNTSGHFTSNVHLAHLQRVSKTSGNAIKITFPPSGGSLND